VSWRSTTFRFALVVFFLQLGTAILLLLGAGSVLRGQINRDATATAEEMRQELISVYADKGNAGLIRGIEIRSKAMSALNEVVAVLDRNGTWQTGNLQGRPVRIMAGSGYRDEALRRIGSAVPELVHFRATTLSDGSRLLTGVVIEREQHILGMLGRVGLMALILSFAFAALAAWSVARLISARVGRVIAIFDAVRSGDLQRRLAPDACGDAFAMLSEEVNRTLDRLDALITQFRTATDHLAHDLRLPLTRLHMSLEVAARDTAGTSSSACEAIDRALEEEQRLMTVLEAALAISRAEAGIGREYFEVTDLATILFTIQELYAPLAGERGRKIEVLAPATTKMPVHRALIYQAVGNLVDNAIKYGAGTIKIALETAKTAGIVRLLVSDEGAGIPDDLQAEALRRFGRLDNARDHSGAGLGLSLVGATARLHDGKVELRNDSAGFTAIITLHNDLHPVQGLAADDEPTTYLENRLVTAAV
jgi:signal transduction histidine kinase